MSTIQAILVIAASLLGTFGMWYFRKEITAWLQRWQDEKNAKSATQARIDAQVADQQANADSDALKKIDGR